MIGGVKHKVLNEISPIRRGTHLSSRQYKLVFSALRKPAFSPPGGILGSELLPKNQGSIQWS